MLKKAAVELEDAISAYPDRVEGAVLAFLERFTAPNLSATRKLAVLIRRGERPEDEFCNKVDSPRNGYLLAPIEKHVVNGMPLYYETLLPSNAVHNAPRHPVCTARDFEAPLLPPRAAPRFFPDIMPSLNSGLFLAHREIFNTRLGIMSGFVVTPPEA